MLLVTIASISLLVGGIGIMNVMLVSVTERTREIGVRVAVGAPEEAIQLQFLGESVMLSLVGGAAGVIVGMGASFFVGRALGLADGDVGGGDRAGGLFSVAVGVFFGYYPARKASRWTPSRLSAMNESLTLPEDGCASAGSSHCSGSGAEACFVLLVLARGGALAPRGTAAGADREGAARRHPRRRRGHRHGQRGDHRAGRLAGLRHHRDG